MNEKYEILEPIGQGSFGVIRKIRRKQDNKLFVRKEINYGRMSEKERRQMVNEVNILNKLRHPNIVRYHERLIDHDQRIIYIIMEYCSGGDLAVIIKHYKANNMRIPEDTIWQVTSQILLALHECHEGRVIKNPVDNSESRVIILHRDLKPDNIFLDEQHNVKLGDFGLSRAMEAAKEQLAHTFLGTPYYMSPELISGMAYNSKTDIWSLGCIIYEMCALHPPFPASNLQELNQKIQHGAVAKFPDGYSRELQEFVMSMLKVNPELRPTTAKCLEHQRFRAFLRETEAQYAQEKLKTYEKELSLREANIKSKEETLKSREEALNSREEALKSREEALTAREQQLNALKSELQARRTEIELRKEINARQEEALRKQVDMIQLKEKKYRVNTVVRRNDAPYNKALRPVKRGLLIPEANDMTLDNRPIVHPIRHPNHPSRSMPELPTTADLYTEDNYPSPYIKRPTKNVK